MDREVECCRPVKIGLFSATSTSKMTFVFRFWGAMSIVSDVGTTWRWHFSRQNNHIGTTSWRWSTWEERLKFCQIGTNRIAGRTGIFRSICRGIYNICRKFSLHCVKKTNQNNLCRVEAVDLTERNVYSDLFRTMSSWIANSKKENVDKIKIHFSRGTLNK